MDINNNQAELLSLTADIVSSHVSNNEVGVADLPNLIQSIYGTLSRLGEPARATEPKPEPAVSIRASVKPDYIVCLEDGKKLKMLKRHLMTNYNMTPEQYRAKWNLPADYPMVAPNYAQQRRQLALDIGLGRKPDDKAPAAAAAAAAAAPATSDENAPGAEAPRKRGRPRKAAAEVAPAPAPAPTVEEAPAAEAPRKRRKLSIVTPS